MNIKSNFDKNGYNYELIYLENNNPGQYCWCVYVQRNYDELGSPIPKYLEIQKVRKRRGTSTQFGRVEGETYYQYPCDSDWGYKGWTVSLDTDYISFIKEKEMQHETA